MATLLLQYAGAAAGGALGGPIGALVGRAVGSLAGASIDERLFGAKLEGPRLASLQILGADEGQPIPALWGRARIAGQLIWAAPIEEQKKSSGGGKGGPNVSEYSYSASFAVGLCEGPVSRIGRIWADGNEIDPATHDIRFHDGSESQLPDSLIAAREDEAPAYRGLAYVVFTQLPLGPFGNRVPQLTFEVFRPVSSLAGDVGAVCLMPGRGEFAHDPWPVFRDVGLGRIASENQNGSASLSDWQLSMAQLKGACPSIRQARLEACWFATSLNAGPCEIRPAVEAAVKLTNPASWSVAGTLRANAAVLQQPGLGTPDDGGMMRAIADLKARGIGVLFSPQLKLDLKGEPEASAITALSRADVENFFARYGRMVLHYALLCAKAGGVDSFLIGSGLSGLIRFRDAAGHPAVEQLVSLAEAVRGILPTAKIGFAAQNRDHEGYAPQASEWRYPLDRLWASAAIDFIGVENLDPGQPQDLGLKAWWSASHYEREAGKALASPTAFVAKAKPIWLTAVGAPAVNARDVRDDEAQRRALAATIAHWKVPQNNPGMVDVARIYIKGWDVRPFPAFPHLGQRWPDASTYATGLALNGRLEQAPLADLLPAVLSRFAVGNVQAQDLEGAVDGFLIERPMRARDALETTLESFGVDVVEDAGRLIFRNRGTGDAIALADDALVEDEPGKPLRKLARAAADSLPNALRIAFMDPARDYQPGAAEARRRDAQGRGEGGSELPLVMTAEAAELRAAQWLQDSWAQADTAEFMLPLSLLALEPGDVVRLEGSPLLYRITQAAGFAERRMMAVAVEPSIYDLTAAVERRVNFIPPTLAGPPALALLDLPLIGASERPGLIRLAAARAPWTEALALLRREGPAAYRALFAITKPAAMGVTLSALPQAPAWRVSPASLRVRMSTGVLRSVSREELLGGANVAALGNSADGFELIQFENAELVAEDTYVLSGLLRGQFGSEPEIRADAPAGSMFVMLDDSLADAGTRIDDIGRSLTFRAGPASRDPADAAYAEVGITPAGRQLRPLRPVHLRGRRTPAGIALSWLRRTRGSGDSWEIEPALGEESEAWSVEVFTASGTRLAQAVTAGTQFTFTSDEPAPARFRVRLAQLSASYGPGAFLEEMIRV